MHVVRSKHDNSHDIELMLNDIGDIRILNILQFRLHLLWSYDIKHAFKHDFPCDKNEEQAQIMI